ncbi:TetR/AcrR family transcriptional regulator [Sphingomonas naphthae]|uniref:TetR/AcrR family transcriptional regulator n=1 Tax=Sphingomonas naphthae TaxID=1813468 RepID=A0ABY7THK9_9SPHN|nr:TetR/AcrR family transcriptional regulator [Sphingomonas naphthae]WCT72634.1 TetR/AcrR family transcriptional regulator [Sphingomonas naphthae]
MSSDSSLAIPADARRRILEAAVDLVAQGGGEAATTRAVAAGAGVQAPTIYRLFGDKDGLLAAVADKVMADFVAAKAARPAAKDPIADLRDGWDDYIAFGLANPAVFTIMTVLPAGRTSATTAAGLTVLRERVNRVARSGRLRVDERNAVDLIHAAGTGTILTLLAKPPADRSVLSTAARDAVLAAILDTTSREVPTVTTMATGLRANLADIPTFSPGERLLLDELLARVAKSGD